MAMKQTSTQLGCGRSIDGVWDNIGHRPDPHEATCPFCQAARADLAGLADATHQLRHDDAHNPDLQAGPDVVNRIMAIARSEVRRGRRLPLHHPGPDQVSELTVSEQAVTAAIRRVGDRTRAVQIRRCALKVVPSADAARFPARSPSAVTVSLKVSVSVAASIPRLVADLRAAITEAVDQEVGMDVRTIDVAVEDVFDA